MLIVCVENTRRVICTLPAIHPPPFAPPHLPSKDHSLQVQFTAIAKESLKLDPWTSLPPARSLYLPIFGV